MRKVAIVTGASSGLGRSIAAGLGKRGCSVALFARRKELLEEVASEVTASGGEAVAVSVDLGSSEQIESAFELVDKQFGNPAFLFNAAGVAEPVGKLVDSSDSDLIRALNTNLLGMYVCTRESLRRMRDDGGTIVNITSGASSKPYAGLSSYCSQKAAVDMFTRVVALEHDDSGVSICAIAPGVFESSMQETMRTSSQEDLPDRQKFLDLHREGKIVAPEIPAGLIIDLAFSGISDLNGLVTDVRSGDLHRLCTQYGIDVPVEYRH